MYFFVTGVTNVLSTTPLWVANTRLKLQGTLLRRQTSFSERGLPHYYGMFRTFQCFTVIFAITCISTDALKTIYRQEGLFALWCGTLPSVVLASNPAVQFMVYEALKRRYAANGNAKVSDLCELIWLTVNEECRGLCVLHDGGLIQDGRYVHHVSIASDPSPSSSEIDIVANIYNNCTSCTGRPQ